MSRENRAKQFAPFDALKGLQDALRLKEYEHDRVQKGDVPEEKANEISNVLLSLESKDKIELVYFEDGHEKRIKGQAKIIIEEQVIEVENKKILLDNILDIKKL